MKKNEIRAAPPAAPAPPAEKGSAGNGGNGFGNGVYNLLSVDVEDYFMVSGFSGRVRLEDWSKYESRVEASTKRLLDILSSHDVKGTFFVLGWVAERFPALVREIHGAGHEVASHGYNHRLIYELTPQEFREDIRRTKGLLEDITGSRVKGFRATSYSIVMESRWALDILIEEGHLYDSSIFPVRHDRYGIPGAKRFPHLLKQNNGTLLEIPPSTYRFLGMNLPVAGGGYFRLYPLWFTIAAIKSINRKERMPAIFYIHPWEIDTEQPRINSSWLSGFRHYVNIESTSRKLCSVIDTFKFKPFEEVIDEHH
jgi:polysaccharide deacetylase family protein (PEP-CTERM system associated)